MGCNYIYSTFTLLGTKTSQALLKIIFLFPRWDMLVSVISRIS